MDAHIVAPPLAGQVLGAEAGAFVLAEWRDPGGPPGPPRLIAPRHVHHHDDEAWYVLDGRLRVQVGTQEVEVPAGAGAFVPRGTPHTYWNPDRAPVRYLLVMTPRIYQLIQALHALADRSPAALRAVFRAYESDLLEP
jgi:mannose-6-phosphate isomerase-like protein (cupin superfamily)